MDIKTVQDIISPVEALLFQRRYYFRWLLVLVSFVAVAWKGTYKQREVFTLYALMFSTYHLVFCSLANIKNPKGTLNRRDRICQDM